MSDWKLINLNDSIRVKLKPKGVDAITRHWRKYVPDWELKLDADGYYVTQLWCLMAELGADIGMGFDTPCETSILIWSNT